MRSPRVLLLAWLCLAPACLPRAAAAQQPPAFGPEEIEQLVAPIALYPDALVAQVLMASTYPLEVVEAARWAKQNPGVTGDALEQAMQQQSWDASVKSLTAFPQVLTMMDEKLDWTQKLGDAFLAQQQDVMSAVQNLRARARAEGNLESNEEQTVVVEPAPAGAPVEQTTIIQIEPANPQVVYVPTYNPTVVYGPWPYPAYPPYYYYPPGYVATASFISFGVGIAVGAALWGNCNWGHGNVNVNVNRYNQFNHTHISNKNWEHNVQHRKGVEYRDRQTQQRFGRDTSAAKSREAFRGRAEQGRQELARGGAESLRGTGARERAPAAGRETARTQRPTAGSRAQGLGGTRSGGAFDGIGSGAQVRNQSSRGHASRQSAMSHSRGGGFSGGGGARRGGGGGGRRR